MSRIEMLLWMLMSSVIIFVPELLAVSTDQERQEARRVFLPPIASLGLLKSESYSISFTKHSKKTNSLTSTLSEMLCVHT